MGTAVQPQHGARMQQAPSFATHYELQPLLDLPTVDLRTSVHSKLPRCVITDRFLRTAGSTRLTVVGFTMHVLLTVAVFVVPHSIGRIMAPIAVTLGLPGICVGLTTLRYDLVVVLVKTYDMWFFAVVSTLSMTLLGLLLRDVRAVIAVNCWFAFFTNIFFDANIQGMRALWIANMFTATGFLVVAAAVGLGVTPELHDFNIFVANGHALPAAEITRDGLVTIGVVVLRNVYRRTRTILTRRTRSSDHPTRHTVQCVSFRCRLSLHPRSPGSSTVNDHLASSTFSFPVEELTPQGTTRLRFVPYQKVFDSTSIVLPMLRWIQQDEGSVAGPHRRRWFRGLGWIGVFTAVAVLTVEVVAPEYTTNFELTVCSALGSSAAIIFTAICLGLCQRQLLWELITSFDFVYFTFQVTALSATLAGLCQFRAPMMFALAATWCLSEWLLFWDAMLPSTRATLGLDIRFPARVCTVLVIAMSVAALAVIVILPPEQLNDRAFISVTLFSSKIEIRAMSWFFNCTVTISAWVIRLLWRLWRATETELVLLDGCVIFDFERPAYDPRHTKSPRVGPRAILPEPMPGPVPPSTS